MAHEGNQLKGGMQLGWWQHSVDGFLEGISASREADRKRSWYSKQAEEDFFFHLSQRLRTLLESLSWEGLRKVH